MARGQQTEKKKKPIKYFDYSLLFLIIFLLCFGLVMLYSTSSYAGSNKFGDASYFVKKQLFATGLGIVGMYIVSKIPYRFWMKVSSMALDKAHELSHLLWCLINNRCQKNNNRKLGKL